MSFRRIFHIAGETYIGPFIAKEHFPDAWGKSAWLSQLFNFGPLSDSVRPDVVIMGKLYKTIADHILPQVQLVFSYLNYQTINDHLGDSTTDMLHELETFSDRYNAVHNTNIDLGTLHRDYLRAVLVPRLEGVQEWLRRRLTQLDTLWQNQNQQTPGNGHIQGVILSIQQHLADVNNLELNANTLPPPP